MGDLSTEGDHLLLNTVDVSRGVSNILLKRATVVYITYLFGVTCPCSKMTMYESIELVLVAR